jgi:hypothetical protein
LGEICTSEQARGQRPQPIKIAKQPVLLPVADIYIYIYIYTDTAESCFYLEDILVDCKRFGILPSVYNHFVYEQPSSEPCFALWRGRYTQNRTRRTEIREARNKAETRDKGKKSEVERTKPRRDGEKEQSEQNEG